MNTPTNNWEQRRTFLSRQNM